jgi:glycosyltransferase involved in cell wall biosynthesis
MKTVMVEQGLTISQEGSKTPKKSGKSQLISDTKIHIIMPAYNEENAIIQVLDEIIALMNNKYNYVITVIDDGSSDNTYKLLQDYDKPINLKKNIVNLGKGQTIRKGFGFIKDDEICVMIDSDGEHPPKEIPYMLEPILNKEADIVIGSRFLKDKRINHLGGSYLKNQKTFSYFRKFGNVLISFLVYIFHNRFLTDTQCGFRAYAPGIVKHYKPNYMGFEVETELTIRGIKNHHRITEVPIDSGLSTRESHMNILKDSIKIFLLIVDMKMVQKSILLYRLFHSIYPQKRLIKRRRLYKDMEDPLPGVKELRAYGKDKLISIIIPCYNEAKTIVKVIKRIEDTKIPNYEIIIVDDASTDNSAALCKKFKNTRVIVHKKNKGYGKSLLDGIIKSKGDIFVTMDSDGQHDPSDIPNLCKPIIQGKANIVVGSRYAGEYFYRIPFVNRLGECGIEVLMRILYRQKIVNNQGGMRAFERKTIDLFNSVRSFGMAFTIELLLAAFYRRYKVVEAPIHLYGRPVGKSRVKKLKLLFDIVYNFIYYFLGKLKKQFRINLK